jgi:hypothetical protein
MISAVIDGNSGRVSRVAYDPANRSASLPLVTFWWRANDDRGGAELR